MADVKIKKPDGTWVSIKGPQGVPGPAGADGAQGPAGADGAPIDFTGCTQIDLFVSVNKVGSGTQSWQLWNVTDGAELMVINDAAGTGDKVLTASKTTSLPTGIKTVRLRAKSTTAADDPVYYGGSVRVTY